MRVRCGSFLYHRICTSHSVDQGSNSLLSWGDSCLHPRAWRGKKHQWLSRGRCKSQFCYPLPRIDVTQLGCCWAKGGSKYFIRLLWSPQWFEQGFFWGSGMNISSNLNDATNQVARESWSAFFRSQNSRMNRRTSVCLCWVKQFFRAPGNKLGIHTVHTG